MAETKKKKKPPTKLRTPRPATSQAPAIKWCAHGINEKFCVSCKKPPKDEKKK